MIMFILLGIAICIGKLVSGDKSMGCLIPILIVTLIAVCLIPFLNLLTLL